MHTTAQVTLGQPQRDEAEYREALALIEAQTQRLARIVEDMFTLARADAGHRALQRAAFYLDELLAETVRAAQVLGERKGINIVLQPTTETLYHGDEGLLRQTLLNLLDNALKHTPPGGTISIQMVSHSSNIEIVVADTGSGIPLEAQSHIFERFYRADAARSQSATLHHNGSGAGLGLSIARWVAEAHGGTIKLLHSRPTGTTFAISLPFNPA